MGPARRGVVDAAAVPGAGRSTLTSIPPILVVSGCPGTGKTTLAAALAAAEPRGVHVVTDVFYRFFSHPIVPIRPEAREQNTAAIRAIAAASAAFAASGCAVFVDGVIGPWFLPTFLAEVAPLGVRVDYVVLRAPLAETLARAMARAEARADDEVIVRHMHSAFADLGAFEAHAVDTAARPLAATRELVERRRARGDLSVSTFREQ